MKTNSPMTGLVLQGYFCIERFRGAGKAVGVQRKPSARPTPRAPRPELLPARMLGGAVQPKTERGSGSPWSRTPRPELLPGMGRLRVGGPPRAAQARSSQGVSITPIPAGQLRVIGEGRPLEPGVLQTMESFFGADFSRVRVHEGPAARAMGALAFTLGEQIHLAPGLYAPGRRDGMALLGHELAHVVQQREGRVANPYGHGIAIVQDPALEAEADAMGRRVAIACRPFRPELRGAALQRSERQIPSNIGTTFTTSKGSRYDVEEGEGLSRARYYGGTSVSEKTVLYGTAEQTEACGRARRECDKYTVGIGPGFGQVTLTFYYKGRQIYVCVLSQVPTRGSCPVDFVANGKTTISGDSDDRFHYGDRIDRFL